MSAVHPLIQRFCEANGLPINAQEPLRIAIEVGDAAMLMTGTRLASGREALELWQTVATLPTVEADASIDWLLQAHRLNYEAHDHHGWRIALGEDRVLGIRQTVVLDSLELDALESLIMDGLERAEALRQLFGLSDGKSASSPVSAAEQMAAGMMRV